MRKCNLRGIMGAAWRRYRTGTVSFSLTLRILAWSNEKTCLAAMEASGIAEETHTLAGWKQRGYEVRHQSKAFFQATITDPATKSGTRRVSNFGLSRVQLVTV